MSLYHKSNKEIDQEYKLIRAAQKNPAHFSVLYERYYAQIRAFIFRRIHADALASDITSQVFMKALHHLPKYKFKGVPFAAYLYRIASNEVNLEFRKKQREPELHLPFDRIPDFIDENDLELQETRETHLMLLKKGFEQLGDQEIELLEMYYFQDMSFREIAAYFGIKENNAKVKAKRIRDKLKKLIEEDLNNLNE